MLLLGHLGFRKNMEHNSRPPCIFLLHLDRLLMHSSSPIVLYISMQQPAGFHSIRCRYSLARPARTHRRPAHRRIRHPAVACRVSAMSSHACMHAPPYQPSMGFLPTGCRPAIIASRIRQSILFPPLSTPTIHRLPLPTTPVEGCLSRLARHRSEDEASQAAINALIVRDAWRCTLQQITREDRRPQQQFSCWQWRARAHTHTDEVLIIRLASFANRFTKES